MARKATKPISCMKLLAASFFFLVAILGGSNMRLFIRRQTSMVGVRNGLEEQSSLIYQYDRMQVVENSQVLPPSEMLQDIPASETRGSMPLMMPRRQHYQSVTQNQEVLPLWRHRVDCPAGASALCSLDNYEAAVELYSNESHCLLQSITPASISDASRTLLENARNRLRERIAENSPGESSALTGYAPLQKVSNIQRWSNQIGCANDGKDVSYDEQITAIAAKWRRQSSTDIPLGFTMTDRRYAGLVEEQLYTARAVVGLETFFVVAYDRFSKDHACDLKADVVTPIENKKDAGEHKDEYAALSQAGGPKDRVAHAELRSRTTLSKFIVARSLARKGITFIFWEMDVFIFKKPNQILTALRDPAVDLVISSHQVKCLQVKCL